MAMHETSSPSFMELAFDQLEELIVTLIEDVRERPMVALAILAGVLGATIGTIVAARASRARRPAITVVAKRAQGLAETGDLLGLALRLLQNPIVRGYLTAMLRRRLAR